MRKGIFLLASLIAGLIGGMLSQIVFDSPAVFATNKEPIPEVIKAKKFLVVDKDGNGLGEFAAVGDTHSTLIVHGKAGKGMVQLSMGEAGPLCLLVGDRTEIISVATEVSKLSVLGKRTMVRVAGEDALINLAGQKSGLVLSYRQEETETQRCTIFAEENSANIFLKGQNTSVALSDKDGIGAQIEINEAGAHKMGGEGRIGICGLRSADGKSYGGVVLAPNGEVEIGNYNNKIKPAWPYFEEREKKKSGGEGQ